MHKPPLQGQDIGIIKKSIFSDMRKLSPHLQIMCNITQNKKTTMLAKNRYLINSILGIEDFIYKHSHTSIRKIEFLK